MGNSSSIEATAAKRTGTCHCGAVRFEVTVDASRGSRCNCSICSKLAQTGAIVKPEAFALLQGEGDLSTYAWGGKTATRYFCKHCGVHCFGRGNLPQLGGDYVSINLNALDDIDPREVKVVYWDGRHNNWQAGPRDTAWPIVA
jgi:hypothetical protein